MAKIEHIKVGEPITADFLNAIAEQLERASKLTIAQGSYLEFISSPFGKVLTLRVPKEIPARLVGSSSPYSWVALADADGGTWTDRSAGLTGGTANAYEVNGKSGLDGEVVWLTWTSAGDWRFQWVGHAPPCGLAVTVNGCLGYGVPGATVELSQSGTLIDSCVTDGRVASVVRTNGGTGGTNGSYTNGTFTGGGGSGATFNYTVSGGVVQPSVVITNQGSGYTSPPTPVFPAGGTGIVASSTLAASCRLTPPSTGTYDLTVTGPSGSGFDTYTGTVNFSCSGSSDMGVGVNLTADDDNVCTNVCNYPLPKVIRTTDGLGLHEIPLVAYNPTTKAASWSLAVSTGEIAHTYHVLDGSCTENGISICFYQLTTTGSSLFFSIGVTTECCDNVTGKFGDGTYSNYGGIGGGGALSGTCYPFDMFRVMPTTFKVTCNFFETFLNVPGGGGLLEFTR